MTSPSRSREEGCVIGGLEAGNAGRGSRDVKAVRGHAARPCSAPRRITEQGAGSREPYGKAGIRVNTRGGEAASVQVSGKRDPGGGNRRCAMVTGAGAGQVWGE